MPQLQDLGRHRTVIRIACIFAPSSPGAPCFFAQGAVWTELQERNDDRSRQREDWPISTPFLSSRAHRIHNEFRQALQLVLAQRALPIALVCQKVLPKGRTQRRKPRFNLLHAFRIVAFKRCTRPNKPAPHQHQHPRLFIGQVQTVARLPDRLDPRE